MESDNNDVSNYIFCKPKVNIRDGLLEIGVPILDIHVKGEQIHQMSSFIFY